jgi:hypothetical protein
LSFPFLNSPPFGFSQKSYSFDSIYAYLLEWQSTRNLSIKDG